MFLDGDKFTVIQRLRMPTQADPKNNNPSLVHLDETTAVARLLLRKSFGYTHADVGSSEFLFESEVYESGATCGNVFCATILMMNLEQRA